MNNDFSKDRFLIKNERYFRIYPNGQTINSKTYILPNFPNKDNFKFKINNYYKFKLNENITENYLF